jgi:glycosyltransferase involved in cell wall biosynthesis
MTPLSVDVSIVIPCHNHAKFLGDAIRSIEAGRRTTEVIVVDDGSTDGSWKVAALFGVACVRQPNQGLAAARNAGLARAAGRYVIFLDADDRLLPNAIDCGARALDERPACAMAFGRSVMIGSDGQQLPTTFPAPIERDHQAALLRRNMIWMPAAAIFRRDALAELGGFAAGFDAAADYELYLRLTERWPAHDHGTLVAEYRRHAGNMSGNASRMLRETLTVMRRHKPRDTALRSAWEEGRRNWREFYGTQLIEEIRGHVRRRELLAAARKAMTLARWHPAGFLHELTKKAHLVARRLMSRAAIPPARTRGV